MDKTREEFIVFIRQAINDRKSVAYNELYNFLVSCFVRADKSMTGQVDLNSFDTLIEEAADLPRKYGYAPKSETMYSSEALRLAGRARMFLDMDTNGSGYITLDKWVDFAITHIMGKTAQLPKDYLGGSSSDVSKGEFIAFMKVAVNKKSPEYRELYFFLLKTFQAGDTNQEGRVNLESFDNMIEAAAAAPRRFGLAPKTSAMYKNDAARLAERKKVFTSLDVNKDGYVYFLAWLNYAYEHIVKKVAGLA